MNETVVRDLVFVSYAWEDSVFADWLFNKLTSEGYKVFKDNRCLFGGEDLPSEVEHAIRNRTARLLALMSKSSLEKPNPKKERIYANNVARENGLQDFIIFLNLDGRTPSEIGWLAQGTVFVPFSDSWSMGLAQLFKALEKSNVPRDAARTRPLLADFLNDATKAQKRPETIFSNLLEIHSMPTRLLKFKKARSLKADEVAKAFVSRTEGLRNSADAVWSFDRPPRAIESGLTLQKEIRIEDIRKSTRDIKATFVSLLHKAIYRHVEEKGLLSAFYGRACYFPFRLVPEDKLHFIGVLGKETWVQVIGIKTVTAQGEKRQLHHHLAPNFRVLLDRLDKPVIRIRNSLMFTDTGGVPVDLKRQARLRKAMCKFWFNDKFGNRALAVAQWLGEGRDAVEIYKGESGTFSVAGMPISFSSEYGLDESTLGASDPVEEEAELNADIELDSDED